MSVNKITDATGSVGRLVIDTNVLFFSAAGAPVDGVSGSGAGVAGIGSLYVNSSNGDHYRNTNTQASPTWTLSN
jgi:hypothetical protein